MRRRRRLRKRRPRAVLVMALFLTLMCIDYGGAMGLKTFGALIALAYIFFRKSSWRVYAHRWTLFVVPVGLPILIAGIHAATSESVDGLTYAVRLYNTISSPLLLLMLPLFYFVGAPRTTKMVSRILTVVACVILTLFLLQISGRVDLMQWRYTAFKYRLGAFGPDVRLPNTTPANERMTIQLGVGFAIPLAFGHALYSTPVSAMLMLCGVFILGSRGLLVGMTLILAAVAFRALRRRGVARRRMFVALVLIVFVSMAYAPIRYRISNVFLKRVQRMWSEIATQYFGAQWTQDAELMIDAGSQDFTTRIRIEHFRGYRQLIAEDRSVFWLGAGPTGEIPNRAMYEIFGERTVPVTEIALLNYAVWYGFPFAMLFAAWLFAPAVRLWRLRRHPSFTSADYGLLAGVTIFWLTGNFNPTLVTPLSIIGYMLLVVRTDELRHAIFVPARVQPVLVQPIPATS